MSETGNHPLDSSIAPYFMAAIIESAEDAIISKTPNGIITSWNKGAERIFGYTAEEAIGKPILILIPPRLHSEEKTIVQKIQRGERVEHYETIRRRKDGTLLNISLTISPIKGEDGTVVGASKIARDITSLKRTEQQLYVSEDRYRTLFNSIDEGFCVLEVIFDERNQAVDWIYLEVNPAFEKHNGLVNATGKRVRELLPDLETHWFEIYGNIALTGESVRFEQGSQALNRWFDLYAFRIGEPEDRKVAVLFKDISEHKRVEQEREQLLKQLEAERSKLAYLFNKAPAFVATLSGPQHIFELTNPAYLQLIGHRNVIGKPAREALPEVEGQGFFELLDKVFQTGEPFTGREVPVQLQREPGGALEQYFVDFVYQPIFEADGSVSGILCHGIDVSEMKRSKDRQRFLVEATSVMASSLDYQATLSSVASMAVPDLADWCAVDLLEEDGSVKRLAVAHVDPEKVKWAHELQQRLPYDPQAPTGLPNVLRTSKSELYPEVTDAMLVAAAKDEDHLQIMREIGFSSAMIVPLVAHGRTLGGLTFICAESKRHYGTEDLALAEDLAGRAALAISNARLYRDSQESSRLKDEFLATMSHELRTPLNAILGWASLLSGGRLSEESTMQALETIERNARSQVRLIEDLMDVSRIITGKLRLDVRPVELAAVVEAAADAVRPTAEAKNIRLQLLLDRQAGPVSGDPDRLQQVMWNLLSNAVKFTPKDGRVQVRLERIDSHVEITVSDTGQGISAEFLPHVFDRFRQADSTNTRGVGGLGLGLAIVRQMVELHGGTAQAASAGEGQGATFTITLPIVAVHNTQAARATDQERIHLPAGGRVAIDCPPALKGLKVLVVDDETDARGLVVAVLEQCDAEVTAVTSADEALEAIVSVQPDVLISDIGMPGEDGYSLIKRVRALPPQSGGRIPAVALTAYARAEDRIKALASGFQMHAPKPVEPAELVAIVASLAERREIPAESSINMAAH
jgi:PAS domain S-box-containing protein